MEGLLDEIGKNLEEVRLYYALAKLAQLKQERNV